MFSLLATGFPLWCHNILTIANSELPPLRTGRAPLTHPAPHQHVRTDGSPRAVMYEFIYVPVSESLVLELIPSGEEGGVLLSAIEVVESGAKEAVQ